MNELALTCKLSPEALALERATVEGDRYRHLFRARRVAVGDTLRVVDGRGRSRQATVVEVGRQQAVLALGEELASSDPAGRVELLVAALRPERAAWLVEKGTELGVWAIRFLASERTPRQYGSGRLQRLSRVATAALEQSGGAREPLLSGVHEWAELPQLLSGLGRRIYLHPGAQAWQQQPAGADRVALLVGPEGGWSEAELEQLAAQGCVAAGLGPRILRVETAALCAAALCLLP